MTTFQPEVVPGEAPPPDAVSPRESTPRTPTSITRLNETIRGFVERWGSVWVEGEITTWNLRGGNVFGRMKDPDTDATIAFRLWSKTLQRLPNDLKVGDRVIACVKADYFVKSGEFTFAVSSMRQLGLGEQLEKLERLRAQLRGEGLFDRSRKKELPFLPRLIGLVTGERSDAEKDVLRNAQLRWPAVRFRIEYAAVQGDQCVPTVIRAVRVLDADPEVDVIVVARGGGDVQNLLGFSDERLARAVAAASTPIVSAIGHENDHPILDDVADLRASTPTDAAKRIVPDVAEQLALVHQARARLTTRLVQRLRHDSAHLEQLRSRPVLRDPDRSLQERVVWLDQAVARGRAAAARTVTAAEHGTAQLRSGLRALSPQHTLDRGYAIVQVGGAIVRDADDAPAGADALVTVARGSFGARSLGAVTE